MSTAYMVRDSATMLRRDFQHLRRYPVMTIGTVGTPTAMFLLFVYFFGGATSASIGHTAWVNYLVPGILMMTVGSGCAATAVGVNMDMTEGIVARFRTMSLSRASVLTGHVLGSMARTMIALVLVLTIAFVVGFRPTASALQWGETIGFIALLTFAMTWLATAFGMMAKSPAGANGSTLLLQFGPFVSSAFAKPETMSPGVRWFAENQPFTQMIETLRALLLGAPIGNHGLIALGWCGVIALGGYLWSRTAYNRDPRK